jgi:signal transduction histidine kinase
MDVVSKEKPIKLSDQIKRTIGYRIILCFLLTMCVIFALTFYDVVSGVEELEKNLDLQCTSLADYTISQLLISSPDAVKLRLDNLNKNSKAIKFSWSNKTYNKTKTMQWRFPFSWQYIYPINNAEATNFGSFIINGSILYDQTLISELETKILLLLVFLFMIFTVLYPLSKKIPRKLFIAPIDNLLQLLRSGNNNTFQAEAHAIPEEINEIRDKIIALLKDAEDRSRVIALNQIAAQVVHDIRSPLSALNASINDTYSSPEKRRNVIRNCAIRINDIANNLLLKYRQGKNKNENEIMLFSEPAVILLESIIAEKKINLSNSDIEIKLEIDPDSYNTFIEVESIEFKRILSNIINNSLESFDSKGKIKIKLFKNSGKIYISIRDNGCGISKNQIHLVLEEGISFGKKNGSGLGLPYAINKITSWHGDYTFDSEIGVGTHFEIILPQAKPAIWCAQEINITQKSKIVILDDEEYIHRLWENRFSQNIIEKNDLKLFYFYSPPELIAFCQSEDMSNTYFLLDFELIGHTENGMMLAEKLNIGSKTILVTSLYESIEIRRHCEKLGIRILPKFFAEVTPINFIDDDEYITNIWIEKAKIINKKIRVFNDIFEFMEIFHLYDKKTLIYIDSSLGGNLKGEEFAKILYDKGYQNIFLATGYPPENFKNIYWVKEIIGKEPPF